MPMWGRDTYTNMHTIPNQFHSPQPINAASIHVFLGQVKGAATALLSRSFGTVSGRRKPWGVDSFFV